jgi:hypothetical protein
MYNINGTLLLPPLDGLYKDNVRNQELPQPGDFRPGGEPTIQSSGGVPGGLLSSAV